VALLVTADRPAARRQRAHARRDGADARVRELPKQLGDPRGQDDDVGVYERHMRRRAGGKPAVAGRPRSPETSRRMTAARSSAQTPRTAAGSREASSTTRTGDRGELARTLARHRASCAGTIARGDDDRERRGRCGRRGVGRQDAGVEQAPREGATRRALADRRGDAPVGDRPRTGLGEAQDAQR